MQYHNFNSQNEIKELKDELTHARKRIKRFKWAMVFFAAYLLFVTFTFMVRSGTV